MMDKQAKEVVNILIDLISINAGMTIMLARNTSVIDAAAKSQVLDLMGKSMEQLDNLKGVLK